MAIPRNALLPGMVFASPDRAALALLSRRHMKLALSPDTARATGEDHHFARVGFDPVGAEPAAAERAADEGAGA